MMKTRKLFAILLAALMIMALLPGCSGSKSAENEPAKTEELASAPESEAEVSAEKASDWPNKPVTIIVPYNAGGDSDFNARALAEKLTELSGQNFVIQNIGGNSGATGSLQALEADPDGYTILFNHTAFSINYFSKTSNLTYDDLTFGAVCGYLPDLILAANPELGMTKLSEVKAYCEQNPGDVIYGGASGTTAIVPGLRMLANGIDITMVDSGGTADRMAAVLGGHVDFVAVPTGNAKDYLTTGELVELENDLGEEMFCPVYYQMHFPKGTDESIVAALNAMLEEIILHDEEYAETIMTGYGQTPFYKNAEDGAVLTAEVWDEFSQLGW